LVSVTDLEVPFDAMVRNLFMHVGHRPVDGFVLSDVHAPATGISGDEAEPVDLGDDVQEEWIVPRGAQEEITTPISDVGLHRKFAKLRSEADILQFASEWGYLGFSTPLQRPDVPGSVVLGERLFHWRREIREMHAMVALQDMLRRRSLAELDRFVTWRDSGVSIEYFVIERGDELVLEEKADWDAILDSGRTVSEDGAARIVGGDLAEIASRTREPDTFSRLDPPDPLGPTAIYISRKVNRRLRMRASPQVLPIRGGEWRLVLPTLRDLMWLQFMWELTPGSGITYCLYCGKPIQGGSQSRQYCGNTCRGSAKRDRDRAATTYRHTMDA
jgi:hypothetical protein